MTDKQSPDSPRECTRSAGQQMRLRLARTRISELRSTDLAEAEPASLIMMIDRLLHTAEDMIALVEEGCPATESHPQHAE